MSKSKGKHNEFDETFNENLKRWNHQEKEENVNLPYDMKQANQRFKTGKENEQINAFCILAAFFNQPEKLESQENFSSAES